MMQQPAYEMVSGACTDNEKPSKLKKTRKASKLLPQRENPNGICRQKPHNESAVRVKMNESLAHANAMVKSTQS